MCRRVLYSYEKPGGGGVGRGVSSVGGRMCDGEQCCGSTFVLCRSEYSKKIFKLIRIDALSELHKAVKAEDTLQMLNLLP
jgi:hypothetical protein